MGCAFSRDDNKGGRIGKKDEAPSFMYYVTARGSEDDDRKITSMACVFDDDDDDDGAIVHSKSKKGSELNSFLGKAGVVGLEKAVEVLDTLGSSMSNLNPGSGFTNGTASRGHKISILAFEVANTIAKGSKLMQSLSKDDIRFLKKEVLPSQGVQCLVSTNTSELLRIAASDKREEFRILSIEIARFGDLCKDPQWHNLTRYFQKLDFDPTPPEKLRDEGETTMQQLVTLAQHTSELYHELHALDRFQQDYKQRLREEELLSVSQRGDGLVILANELKHQRKIVRNLKKKSLWSRNLEEIVEKLVEVVVFLHKEIGAAFGLSDLGAVDYSPDCKTQRLGASGLALHYANIINRIDNIVSRPISMPSNTRDILYNGLPTSVKVALRSRLQSYNTEELTVSQVKAEMQKILQWMAPMAENTIKAHQGFGWVGEWANMGTEVNKKPIQQNVLRILTLYHAEKDKTDEYLLQLVVWLHHLVVLVKDRGYVSKSPKPAGPHQRRLQYSLGTSKEGACIVYSGKSALLNLSNEDRKLLDRLPCERIILGRSRSHGFQIAKEGPSRRLHRSRSIDSLSDHKFLSRWNVLNAINKTPYESFPGVSLCV